MIIKMSDSMCGYLYLEEKIYHITNMFLNFAVKFDIDLYHNLVVDDIKNVDLSKYRNGNID